MQIRPALWHASFMILPLASGLIFYEKTHLSLIIFAPFFHEVFLVSFRVASHRLASTHISLQALSNLTMPNFSANLLGFILHVNFPLNFFTILSHFRRNIEKLHSKNMYFTVIITVCKNLNGLISNSKVRCSEFSLL